MANKSDKKVDVKFHKEPTKAEKVKNDEYRDVTKLIQVEVVQDNLKVRTYNFPNTLEGFASLNTYLFAACAMTAHNSGFSKEQALKAFEESFAAYLEDEKAQEKERQEKAKQLAKKEDE